MIVTYFYLGHSFYRLGKFEESATAFREGVSITPPDNRYYADMVKSLVKINNAQHKT